MQDPTTGPTGPTGPPGPQGPAGPTTTPVKWYQSQGFMIVCKVVAVYVLIWLGVCFSTHAWDFYSLGSGVVSGLTVVVQDWWSPTVIAPFAALNRSNVK